MNAFAALAFVSLCVFIPQSALASAKKIKSVFKDEVAAFSLYDPQKDEWTRFNADRAGMRYTPCSTFKIPNALIALEEKVLKDENQIVKWDAAKDPKQDYWPADWAGDQSLRTAIQKSVLWFFQGLARQIGESAYKKYLKSFRYGNADISGGLDKFWVASSLRISADEQVSFLKRFFEDELGVSKSSTRVVKNAIVLEESGNTVLSGKTGACELHSGRWIGWLVGRLDTKTHVYYYALNLEGKDYAEIKDKRLALVKAAFTKLGFLK